MKETGLMFKAPLVRAILDGQKTQTRRLVKWKGLDKGLNLGFSGLRAVNGGNEWVLESNSRTSSEWRCQPTLCPMGQPGDRIYVRETFVQGYEEDPLTGRLKQWDEEGNDIPMTTWYRATNGGITWSDDGESEANVPWKPAIHMPKSLARIWLEVTGVRVERLQSISRGDAMAEGCPFPNMADGADPRKWFAEVWESTGGDWAANPWVWVIDFKRIEKPQAST